MSECMNKNNQESNYNSSSTICNFDPPPPPPITSDGGFTVRKSLITTSPYGKIVIDRSDIALLTPEIEIQRVFSKAASWDLLPKKRPTLSIYSQIPPIIQRGPQCGLVALSMASHVFPPFVSTQSLLEEAQERGITNHGEMFSSTDFAALANSRLKLSAVVREDILTSPKLLVKIILSGGLLLVPYDSERNYTPGQSHGHKAHWCLICGCIMQFNSFSLIPSWAKQDENIPNLWHYDPSAKENKDDQTRSKSSSLHRNSSSENVAFDDDLNLVVLWRQGKSRNLILSKLSTLTESNAQLEEYPNSENYVIKSVKNGLAGKSIVLSAANYN